MASDIYEYRGIIGNVIVEVSYLDYPRDHECSCGVYSVKLFRKEGEKIQVNDAVVKTRISKLIAEEKITLEYLGGWCSSGYSWGPKYEIPESEDSDE